MSTNSAARAALLSCDVFDTVLTRRVGSPGSLFLILGARLAEKGLIPFGAEAFSHARIEANRRARSNAGRGMGLADIYYELQLELDLSDAERDAIQAEELALEGDLLVPVPGAPERLRQARESGMAVAFLSDMYLGSDFIREQLRRHGMATAADGCYVSCEVGCGKEDGRAFRVMAAREGVDLGAVLHRGNDPRADIAAARAAGITAEPFLEGNLNRYEMALESHAQTTGGLASVMAGAARLARLSVPASDPHAAVLRDVAASVGGPTVVSYVLWVLLRAQDLGIRRLYFVARHDELLLHVARTLIDTLGLDCEAHALSFMPGAAASSDDVPDDLRRTGLLDDRDWAVVDIGWKGSALQSLDEFIRSAGGETPVTTFSFTHSGDGDAEGGSRATPVHAFLSDVDHRGVREEPPGERFLGWFMEADGSGPALSPWGVEVVNQTILSFADWVWLDASALDLSADLRPAVADVLRLFLTAPPPSEARVWGGYPVHGDRNAALNRTIARPFTIREFPHAVRHGHIKAGPETEWTEGALAITPPVTRAILRTGLGLRSRLVSAGNTVRRVLTGS